MKRKLQSLLSDTRGNVLMLTGLALLILIGAAGMGVDLGRQQLVRLKLQQATDAAALAASSMPSNASVQDRQNAALRIFRMNYPEGYLGTGHIDPLVQIGPTSITVSANQQTLNASFMRVIGHDTLPTTATTTVGGSQAAQYYDVALVMDNSGSMTCGVNDEVPNYNAWVLCNSQPKGKRRIQALKESTVALADTLLGGSNTSGNRIALVRWNNTLIGTTAFISSRNIVIANLLAMGASDGTNSAMGLGSVNDTLASQYDADHVKTLILMTDGMNTSVNGGNCPSTGNTADFCQEAYAASAPLCAALKNKGILIYTIAFGRDVNTGPYKTQIASFLSQCATAPSYFYPAPDDKALANAFKDITSNIQKIRITD